VHALVKEEVHVFGAVAVGVVEIAADLAEPACFGGHGVHLEEAVAAARCAGCRGRERAAVAPGRRRFVAVAGHERREDLARRVAWIRDIGGQRVGREGGE
jgi:hypothetical protein